jgi:hypothetical protein
MAITDDQKMRARHHLGYLNVQAAATFQLGIPAAVQTQFVIEGAWEKILPEAMNKFEVLLCRLDQIEEELYGGIDLASVTQVGSIQVNEKRFRELGRYYRHARDSLANLMGIVPNPFDQRELVCGGGAVGNLPVL